LAVTGVVPALSWNSFDVSVRSNDAPWTPAPNNAPGENRPGPPA
jgi:hypothetical protein